ncbi:dTDP-4-dehydrorhamnose reductase [Amycolatopsis sp. H20-H5]|uniref:dTDP-4-dehydrorhamnose reductase n=1 Tax=Amycolatopsis sp. H20-H5 TaxID=3046309 RepID=UPI002DB5A14F|nr:dTDP-4-dehydrorhamnose reductase [Amycolatopsis sp. H20-H5]MEC3978065.1 dTDP-4-dehydrorhamnose reductase [Amycolatopsis sp. H20-H5]
MRLSLLVPGGSGQLGQDLAALANDNVDVLAPSSGELNVTSAGEVVAAVTALATRAKATGAKPVVINAAAYTAVDAAETDENKAFAVNADGPRVLAAVCSSRNIPLVHISTDYVFPGNATSPYEPTDPLGPQSAYGRTKAAGEDAVLSSGARAWIVRTSWVYGKTGTNFVKTITRLEKERETLSVVSDQHGSPTWSADLAKALLELATRIATGKAPSHQVLHCTGAGATTWFAFAQAIFTELGADPTRVTPCTTADFPRPAPRPPYAVLSNKSWQKASLTPLPPWQKALKTYFK